MNELCSQEHLHKIERHTSMSKNMEDTDVKDVKDVNDVKDDDIFIPLFKELKKDYEKTFRVMENGTVNATNDNIKEVRAFLKRYGTLLKFEGLEVADFNLENAGRGQIAIVNKTKKEMTKLLGVANQIYIRACRTLDVQPSTNHIAVKLI